MKKVIILLVVVIIIQSCLDKENPQMVVDASIEVHGFDQFKSKKVSFDFRSKTYEVEYMGDDKIYTRAFTDDSLGQVRDILINSSKFERYVNDTLVDVSDEWAVKYGNSVNSVLYFFQLPYGLNDGAVNKNFLEKSYINGQVYDKIKVTFDQDGGGEDYEDQFIYWIHAKKKTLDFLAYSYATDGGGVRFRQAINRKKVNGMIFQDYINFKPEYKNANIVDLDEMFEEGRLLELSRISNENISVY